MTSKLNPILLVEAQKELKSNSIKAKLLKIASIINFIVICIFTSYLLTLLGASTASMPIIHLCIGLISPAFAYSITKLYFESQKYYERANFYRDVNKKMEKLKDPDKLNKFLEKISCDTTEIKKIIPAIARYKVIKKRMKYYLEEIKDIKKTKSTDPKVKHILQNEAHDIYETKVLSLKLELSELFHIMKNPTSQKSLKDIGLIYQLNFSKRMSSILDNNDLYFIFKKKFAQKKDLKGLTFTQIDNFEIKDISNLIFTS